MRLTELEPKFFRYEDRVEDHQVVDGVWDKDKNDYIVEDGRTWREAGSPTKTVRGPIEYLIPVETLAEATGIIFLCPKCFRDNNGSNGTHQVHMPFSNRGLDSEKHRNQWNVTGTGFDDLSTTPSYLIVGGCGWHGYITNGEVSVL